MESPGTAMSTQMELMCATTGVDAHHTSAGSRRIDDFFSSSQRQLQGYRICNCAPGSYCECAGVRMDDSGAFGVRHLSTAERGVSSGYGKVMELAHVRSCPACTHTVATSNVDMWTRCSYCSKEVCTSCVAECERCCEHFCRFCATTNYSGAYSAPMCIDCNNAT